MDALRKQAESNKQTFSYDARTRMQLQNSLALSEAEVKQRMDNGVPERAQRVQRKAVPSGGADLLWTRAAVLGGRGRPADFTEIGQEGTTTEGDEMRRVRRKSDQGDPAGR